MQSHGDINVSGVWFLENGNGFPVVRMAIREGQMKVHI